VPSWRTLGHLGAMLGCLGAMLGPSRGHFGPSGCSLKPCRDHLPWLGSILPILGPFQAILGPSQRCFGAIFDPSSPLWGYVGPSWDHPSYLRTSISHLTMSSSYSNVLHRNIDGYAYCVCIRGLFMGAWPSSPSCPWVLRDLSPKTEGWGYVHTWISVQIDTQD
jgi:hypothetical protein